MELKDGKFYQDGKEIPAEFGNTEQIRLVRDSQRNDLHPIKVTPFGTGEGFKIKSKFQCKCLCKVEVKETFLSQDSFKKWYDYASCSNVMCGLMYEVGYHSIDKIVAKECVL
jgi:hypothetical protein